MFSCRKDVYCGESFFLLYQCAQCTGTNMGRNLTYQGPKHHGKCQPTGECNPACPVLAAKQLLTNNKSLKSREDNEDEEGEELSSTDEEKEKPKKRKEQAVVVHSTTKKSKKKKSKKKQTKEAAASESQEVEAGPGSEVDLKLIDRGQ